MFYRKRSPAACGLGLVNSLGLFPLNCFLSSGDTAFVTAYLGGGSVVWVAVPYELLRGEAAFLHPHRGLVGAGAPPRGL